MTKKSKDILRYIILGFAMWFAVHNTNTIVCFIIAHYDELEAPVIAGLTGINAAVLSPWIYWLKKMAETQAGEPK